MNGMETLHIGKPLHVYKVRFTGYYDNTGKRLLMDEMNVEREKMDTDIVANDIKIHRGLQRVVIESWKEVS